MLLDSYKTFEPTNYLQEYYSSIDLENRSLLAFFAKAYRDISPDSVMLEFSGGPSLYSLISAAAHVKEIHFSDFLLRNVEEVQLWQRFRHRSYLWVSFFKEALIAEGKANVTAADILEREDMLSKKLRNFMLCDAFEPQPLGSQYHQYYDVVAANFVAESITLSLEIWEKIIGNICSTLRPDGTLIMTAIQGASFYCVEGRRYPAVTVTQEDAIAALKHQGFNTHNLLIQQIPAEITDIKDKNYKGYQGMLFVKAKRE
jgi:hypothetical protein